MPESAKERSARRRRGLTEEQKAAEKRQQQESLARLKQRRISEYLAEHGNPPLCECGCGDRVNFSSLGRPNRYINGHKIDVDGMLGKQYENHYIPAERVREALGKIREERGWTVKQLAEQAGISHGHMKVVLYSQTKYKKYGFDVAWVENVFRRLKGLSAPPTSYMLKQFKESDKRYKSLSEIM